MRGNPANARFKAKGEHRPVQLTILAVGVWSTKVKVKVKLAAGNLRLFLVLVSPASGHSYRICLQESSSPHHLKHADNSRHSQS